VKRNFALPVLVCTLLLGANLVGLSAQTMEVRIPKDMDSSIDFPWVFEALKLALDKSGVDYHLTFMTQEVDEPRAIKMVEENAGDLAFASYGTSKELRYVLVPIFRGLLGFRVPVIVKGDQDTKFAPGAINNLQDLSKLSILQGVGWGDAKILRASGLKVNEVEYENIFKLLASGGRGDLFLTGSPEALAEKSAMWNTNDAIAIEKNYSVKYDHFDIYFMVNKANTRLYDALSKGLAEAYRDGSYLKAFYANSMMKPVFSKSELNLRGRKILLVPNVSAAATIKAIPDNYWE
jgi:hypothetical protein